jgi:hypothetical protein
MTVKTPERDAANASSSPQTPPQAAWGAVRSRGRFAKCDEEWLKMDLSSRELRVLLALSLHADWRAGGHGRCFPKRDTLAISTGLQISHVSEAVGTLARLRVITVVRLGRKNIYYVRGVGSTLPMPPSDPDPFFAWLGEQGLKLALLEVPERPGSYTLARDSGSRRQSNELDEWPLLAAILNDYASGLRPEKLRAAVAANRSATMGALSA